MRWHDEGLEIALPGLPPIWTHISLPVVALLVTAPLWWGFHIGGLSVAAIVIPALMLSVLAHEMGHALVARRLGLVPVAIRLHGGGGEAVLEGDADRRAHDRLITLAGPLANLALAALGFALLWLMTPGPDPMPGQSPFGRPPPLPDSVAERAVRWIAWANLILAAINLLPAFPLDGGLLAHSLLEARWGARRATLWVARCGVVLAGVAMLVFLGSLLAGMPILAPPYLIPSLEALRAARRQGA